jgi:hypothetical protein
MTNSQIETSEKIKSLITDVSFPITTKTLIQLRDKMYSVLDIKSCVDEKSMEHEKTIRWKRTANQIFEDGYVYQGKACTDQVVSFIALCRALGLETRFVKLKKEKMVHSVAEIKLEDGWYVFDVSNKDNLPIKGEITKNNPYGKWQLWQKGRDAWDMGLTDFDSMKKIQ